jgi:hypothetical protein
MELRVVRVLEIDLSQPVQAIADFSSPATQMPKKVEMAVRRIR